MPAGALTGAVVALTRPAGRTAPPKPVSPPADAFYLTPQVGPPVVVPLPPMETSHSGYGSDWQVVDRGPGLDPLLLEGGGQLRTWSGSLTIAYPSLSTSIEPTLAALEQVVERGERVAVHYGPAETGSWRVTRFSVAASWRNSHLHRTRAVVELELTQASDTKVAIRGPKATTLYRVLAGDTLAGLARRFYGSTKYSGTILAANKAKLKNKARNVHAGLTLTIPAL